MKSKLKFLPILFLLPLTAGICGASLRATQLDSPSSYGLVIICVVALVLAAIASFLLKNGIKYSSVFLAKALPIVSFVGAACILAYAGTLVVSLADNFSALTLILVLLSVYACVSFIALGKHGLAEREDTAYCIFSAVPVFWTAFVLIVTFREKITDPVISNYVFLILSYISILVFGYATCAHVLGKNRKNIAVFSCFVGIFFILTELLVPLFNDTVAFEISELLPLIAFLVIMPFYTAEIIRKKD
ncbi:MAG: hypothetical protein IKM21_05580 [Oscillospiraceae bacterium]|nr:hypothetical protein [Oscillospiraceae bacterium]